MLRPIGYKMYNFNSGTYCNSDLLNPPVVLKRQQQTFVNEKCIHYNSFGIELKTMN